MKKYYLLIVTIFTAFMLTACGMSSEDITAYMTSFDASYQSGAYGQAQSEMLNVQFFQIRNNQATVRNISTVNNHCIIFAL